MTLMATDTENSSHLSPEQFQSPNRWINENLFCQNSLDYQSSKKKKRDNPVKEIERDSKRETERQKEVESETNCYLKREN